MIEGASCASCVSKIEKALAGVEGVSGVEMNFAQRTVTIDGDVDSDALIHSVKDIGYNATPMNSASEQDALDEKAQADEAHYKKLMRDMAIALGLGIPLMLYG